MDCGHGDTAVDERPARGRDFQDLQGGRSVETLDAPEEIEDREQACEKLKPIFPVQHAASGCRDGRSRLLASLAMTNVQRSAVVGDYAIYIFN